MKLHYTNKTINYSKNKKRLVNQKTTSYKNGIVSIYIDTIKIKDVSILFLMENGYLNLDKMINNYSLISEINNKLYYKHKYSIIGKKVSEEQALDIFCRACNLYSIFNYNEYNSQISYDKLKNNLHLNYLSINPFNPENHINWINSKGIIHQYGNLKEDVYKTKFSLNKLLSELIVLSIEFPYLELSLTLFNYDDILLSLELYKGKINITNDRNTIINTHNEKYLSDSNNLPNLIPYDYQDYHNQFIKKNNYYNIEDILKIINYMNKKEKKVKKQTKDKKKEKNISKNSNIRKNKNTKNNNKNKGSIYDLTKEELISMNVFITNEPLEYPYIEDEDNFITDFDEIIKEYL